MVLLYYLGTLVAIALAVTLGVAGLIGPAPPDALPPAAARIEPAAPAPEPSATPSAAEARTGHWGPRVAPVPDWSEKAAPSVAAAARQKALMEMDRPAAAARPRGKLPDLITRGDDDSGPDLGYAPAPARSDRFRIY